MAAELPPLPLVGGMDTWMFEAIKSTPISNGLAILIGCTNSSEHEPLRGVVRDLATLQLTFSEKLLFTTLCLNNPTVEHVKMVVKHTSELSKNALALPETWRRIVVTFSGHGDEKYLYTKDDHMCLREDIVKPLQAMKAKKLARLPKLFFIDACRGPDKDDGVYVPDLKKWFSDTSPVPRGGGRVSSTGNCFIAYSTLLGMQAFEDSNKGGFWIQTLAKELANHGNIGRTIQDVMTRVNKELNEICDKKNMAIQQPVTESTLAEDVKLLQEAQDLRQLEYQLLGQQPQVQQQQAAGGCQQHPQLLPQSQLLPQVFPLQQQPGVFEQQEGSQQQQQQHGVYQSQQEGYLQQPQQGGYHLPQQPQLGGYMSQQQQVPQWQQQLLGLRQQQGTYTPPQGYSSQQVGVFQQQQQQHLQQVAWDQQQGVQLQPGQLGPYQQQQHPQGPQQQGGMPVATYQSQQQLQQQGGIPVGTYQSQQQPQQPGGLQLPSGICDATDLLMLNLVADGRGPPGKAREVEARKAGPGNSKDDGLNDHSSSKIAQGGEGVPKRPPIAAVFPSGCENNGNGSTIAPKADAYTLLLSRYARSRGIEERYTDTPCFVEEYNHTYYTSQVVVRGSNGSTTWNGTECHISPEIAREEVAKMAYQSLTGQSVGPTPLTPPSAPARAPLERVPNPQDPPKRNNRTILNEYCQKKGVSQRDEFIEDHSTGQPKFKCTITCLLEGSKIVQDSGQYYPRKDDAKEVAASKILSKIKEREKSRTQGAAGVAAGRGGIVKGTAVSLPNTVWKSQLKEHYDKRGNAGMELKYKTSEVAGGGFVASIFISELSKEVRGERGNNKKEAEQNAAKKAVQQLQQRKLFCV